MRRLDFFLHCRTTIAFWIIGVFLSHFVWRCGRIKKNWVTLFSSWGCATHNTENVKKCRSLFYTSRVVLVLAPIIDIINYVHILMTMVITMKIYPCWLIHSLSSSYSADQVLFYSVCCCLANLVCLVLAFSFLIWTWHVCVWKFLVLALQYLCIM